MKNISISSKLRMLAAVIAIILFGIGIITNRAIKKFDELNALKDKMHELEYLTLQMRRCEIAFLAEEINNEEFFNTGESRYQNDFNQYINQVKSIIAGIKNNDYLISYGLADNVDDIISSLNEYQQVFWEIAEKILQRGYRDWGLVGKMRSAIHSVEDNLSRNKYSSDFSVHMLMLRRHEKDYIIRKDLKYKDRFDNEINAFLSSISSNGYLKESFAENLQKTLKTYQLTFHDVIAADSFIGLSSNSGLKGKLRNEFKQLEPEIEDIINEIGVKSDNTRASITITLILFIILSLMITTGISFLTIRGVTHPVNYLKNALVSMKSGKLPDRKLNESNDEIGEMAKALNQLIDSLHRTASFSLEIGKGNYESDFEPLSEEDILGKSLILMRNNLKKASLEQARHKKEEVQRSWATNGLAKFSDLLRQHHDNMEELSFTIISNLVRYLNANQGGIYLINEEEKDNKVITLQAAIAYERRKYLKKEIKWGEGLVGACIQEGETIYINEIPDDYLHITSGLGEANPKCILIVPLKLNEIIYGAIEMASFHEIEDHQQRFVEDVAESISSTISSVRSNLQTVKLLKETQEQSEKMAQQEEEMRQNMEEMQATQEEAARKETEMNGYIQAIENAVCIVELDPEGNILNTNRKFEDFINLNNRDIHGKHIHSVMTYHKVYRAWEEIRDTIKNKETMQQDVKIFLNNNDSFSLREIYTPICQNNDEVSRVILMAFVY